METGRTNTHFMVKIENGFFIEDKKNKLARFSWQDRITGT